MEYLERVEEDTIAMRSSPAPSLLETYSCSLRPFIISHTCNTQLFNVQTNHHGIIQNVDWAVLVYIFIKCTKIYKHLKVHKDNGQGSPMFRALAQRSTGKHFFNLGILCLKECFNSGEARLFYRFYMSW